MSKMKKWLSRFLAAMLIITAMPAGQVNANETDVQTVVTESTSGLQVESIEFEPVQLIEEYDGFYRGGVFHYSYTPKFVVTLADGTVLKSDQYGRILHQGKYYFLNYQDGQSKSPWQVGEYVVDANFDGIATSFLVKIAECPIASIAVDDESVIEKTQGFWSNEYNEETGAYDLRWFHYSVSPEVTVTLKNGSVVKTERGLLHHNGKYYSATFQHDQSYTNQWEVGIHKIKVSLMGKETEFSYEIVESPIASVVFQDVKLIEGSNGHTEHANPSGSLTWYKYDYQYITEAVVTLKDGTSGSYQVFNYKGKQYSFNFFDDQSYTTPWGVGQHEVTGTIMGKEATFVVEIVEDSIIHVEIIAEHNKDLKVGEAMMLRAVSFPEATIDPRTLTWTTSNSAVAMVQNGLVIAVGPGAATITVTTNNGKTASCEITVTKGEQWIQDSNGWWYCRADGSWPSSGWHMIEEQWYYFNASGYRLENQWVGDYYVNDEGVMVTNQWVGNYYVDGSGAYIARAGWLKIDANWYYLGEGGVRQTGWQCVNGTWYYLDSDGKMASNTWIDSCWVNQDGAWVPNETPNRWIQVGDRWWYRHTGGGYTTNDWELIDGKWYHFDASGWMQYGWLQVAGNWYYLGVANDGSMKTNQWVGDYYVGTDGVMATSQWIGKYYVDETGKWDSTKTDYENDSDNPIITQELIEERRLRNQQYREQLTQTAEYNYISKNETIYQFGIFDINGDGTEELFIYTYNPTEEDNGPNWMLTMTDGEVSAGGKGCAYLENVEYCVQTKHFINTHYYDDGSYDFRIYEYQGVFFGDELIYSGANSDYQFAFHVDAEGQYSFGDIYNLSYSEKLTEEQVAYVEQKMEEYLPTRTKLTAPYAVTQENLDKYLPIDDAGIIAQLTEEIQL